MITFSTTFAFTGLIMIISPIFLVFFFFFNVSIAIPSLKYPNRLIKCLEQCFQMLQHVRKSVVLLSSSEPCFPASHSLSKSAHALDALEAWGQLLSWSFLLLFVSWSPLDRTHIFLILLTHYAEAHGLWEESFHVSESVFPPYSQLICGLAGEPDVFCFFLSPPWSLPSGGWSLGTI